jgi:hypothetical protein
VIAVSYAHHNTHLLTCLLVVFGFVVVVLGVLGFAVVVLARSRLLLKSP